MWYVPTIISRIKHNMVFSEEFAISNLDLSAGQQVSLSNCRGLNAERHLAKSSATFQSNNSGGDNDLSSRCAEKNGNPIVMHESFKKVLVWAAFYSKVYQNSSKAPKKEVFCKAQNPIHTFKTTTLSDVNTNRQIPKLKLLAAFSVLGIFGLAITRQTLRSISSLNVLPLLSHWEPLISHSMSSGN